MRIVSSLLGLLFLTGHLAAWGQAQTNLDFEPRSNASQPLLLWFSYINPNCELDVDTTLAQQGRASLRFKVAREADNTYFHVGTTSVPIDSARGKLLTLSAYVRTADFRGQAGLYAVVGAPEATEHLAINDKLDSLPRTSAWHRLTIQVPVGTAATNLTIGFKLQGTGQVWLDNVQLQFDKRLYQDAPLAGTEPLLQRRLPPADWGFDYYLPFSTPPAAPAYEAVLDPGAPRSRPNSLRLSAPATSREAFPCVGSVRLDSTMWGKRLTISGSLRQQDSLGAPPAFYYSELLVDTRRRRYADRGRLQVVTLPPATAGWQPFSVSLVVPTPAVQDDNRVWKELVLGLALAGSATAWVDDVHFTLNNQPFTPRNPAALPAPTAAEVAWLRYASHPLLSTAASAPVTDLAAFGTFVGSTKLLGLGGAGYGAQELQRLHHRLVHYLVEQKGFTGLVLQADMAACYRVNHYLLTGQGSLPTLLATLGSWNTQPMLALLQEVRLRNQRGGSLVQVMGTGLTDASSILLNLRQATPVKDSHTLTQLLELEKALTALGEKQLHDNPLAATYRKPDLLRQVQALVEDLRTSPLRYRTTTLAQLAWRDQWLRLLEHYSVANTLDPEVAADYLLAAQAENVRWLTQQLAGSKVVLLGQNTFISQESGVGRWLTAPAATGYTAVAITFHTGNLTAYQAGTVQVTAVPPSYPGTYEAYFHAAHLPLAFLDLRQVTLQPATTGWLFQRLLLRDKRRGEGSGTFNRYDLRREFTGFFFLDAVSAAVQVPKSN
jgi:erythromycin esterase-like protein